MQVFTHQTSNSWISNDGDNKPADEEIRRVFSDCFRSTNLIVLTGLGTSLHVNLDTSKRPKRLALPDKRLAPTMWDLWEAAKSKSGEEFENVLALSNYPKESLGENIEALLSYCKIAQEFLKDAGERVKISDFITQAEGVIRDAVDFLDTGDDLHVHSELLRKLARRSSRNVRPKIFTTNYDLCFEYAARKGRYTVIDGFSHNTPQVFDSLFYQYDVVRRDNNPESYDFISNVFHLYKLHGSIDWTKNTSSNEIERQPKTPKPILVYPRNTKYELAFEQPYLEMMAAFQAAIRQPNTGLLIVGFGFNDNHIAEPILSAIRSNLSLKVVVCDPSLGPFEKDGVVKLGTESTNKFLSQIKYLIENGDARLALINSTFEEMVPALPDIAAETDLEQHLERLRRLKEQLPI